MASQAVAKGLRIATSKHILLDKAKVALQLLLLMLRSAARAGWLRRCQRLTARVSVSKLACVSGQRFDRSKLNSVTVHR